MNMMFWNVCIGQPRGVHDAGRFAMSSVATQLNTRQILARHVIHLGGMDIMAYLIDDIAYSSRPYLLKNLKPENSAMIDHIQYISSLFLYLL